MLNARSGNPNENTVEAVPLLDLEYLVPIDLQASGHVPQRLAFVEQDLELVSGTEFLDLQLGLNVVQRAEGSLQIEQANRRPVVFCRNQRQREIKGRVHAPIEGIDVFKKTLGVEKTLSPFLRG